MKTSFLLCLGAGIIFFAVGFAFAEENPRKPNYPILKNFNFNRPQTRDQVLNVYPWRVNKEDGVDDVEARIIAQYEIVIRELDDDFEVSKAKIIEESGEQYVVQIPSKVSVTNKPSRYMVYINKKNGTIKEFKQE